MNPQAQASIAERAGETWLNTSEAARHLGIAANTLRNWRVTKSQRIPHYAFGRAIRYRLADLDAWATSRAAQH